MKIRIRMTSVALILAVSGLNGVPVACGPLCSSTRACVCLTELQECGARGDAPCCDGLQCQYDLESGRQRCLAKRG